MKIVIFGWSATSARGNRQAAVWRPLLEALSALGNRVVFFERDLPCFAEHRIDGTPDGTQVVLYRKWRDVEKTAQLHLRSADAAIVGPWCPDGVRVCDLVLSSDVPRKAFYDVDTPGTLRALRAGWSPYWMPEDRLSGFDLVLSSAGGRAADELAVRGWCGPVTPLYAFADPSRHPAGRPRTAWRSLLTWPGPDAHGREAALERLFVEPARRHPRSRFLWVGPVPNGAALPGSVRHLPWVPASERASLHASGLTTLHVLRADEAAMGHCPPSSLFEAAAAGAAIVSDWWEGLERFFRPGEEILVARSADEMVEMLRIPPSVLARIGAAARRRVLEDHTPIARARRLLGVLERPNRHGGLEATQLPILRAHAVENEADDVTPVEEEVTPPGANRAVG